MDDCYIYTDRCVIEMSEYIDNIFSSVHHNYDLMNTILSLGIDRIWRRHAAIAALHEKKKYQVLDIACGTGEMAKSIYKQATLAGKNIHITGLDYNNKMLGIAKEKFKNNRHITFEQGDAINIKYPADSFDVVTSAFAMRDFDNLRMFAHEIFRVLRPGGKIMLMDMAAPKRGIHKYFFKFYSRIMLLEGYFVDRNSYSFLVDSIRKFDSDKVARIIKNAGFKNVNITYLQTHVAFMICATK